MVDVDVQVARTTSRPLDVRRRDQVAYTVEYVATNGSHRFTTVATTPDGCDALGLTPLRFDPLRRRRAPRSGARTLKADAAACTWRSRARAAAAHYSPRAPGARISGSSLTLAGDCPQHSRRRGPGSSGD